MNTNLAKELCETADFLEMAFAPCEISGVPNKLRAAAATIEELAGGLRQAACWGNYWRDQAQRFQAEGDQLAKQNGELATTLSEVHALAGQRLDRVRTLEAKSAWMRSLIAHAEAKLSEARLYNGYGNTGPLHDYATTRIILHAQAVLKEPSSYDK